MKQILLTTIAAVLLVGCGPSKAELALIQAAKDGNIKATKQAIADGADVNAEDPFKGLRRTPLHRAAYYGHKEIVVLLIAKGANLNVKDDRGRTPLHWAAYHGRKEIAELLITAGVDVNAEDGGGDTPLDTADNKEISALLREHGGKTADWFKAGESIHIAASEGHIEAVKTHLSCRSFSLALSPE
jgi:ankyrin repeat protein